MTNKILTLALASTFSFGVLTSFADETPDLSKLPPASEKKGVTYEKDIKPIFDKHCFKCHGEEKQKGKLRLDSLDAVLKGSTDEDIGQVVKKGDSAHSILVQAVARITPDEDDAMPPAKRDGSVDALSKEQVGLIRAWIDQGAK
jgi:mono/diheme cytochrome c family protein